MALPPSWRIHGVFGEAINLLGADATVVSIVSPRVGNGPLNAVIEARPGDLPGLTLGAEGYVHDRSLRLGNTEITLDGASRWQASPNWDAYRSRLVLIQNLAPMLLELALQTRISHSLLDVLDSVHPPGGSHKPPYTPLKLRILEGANRLRKGWHLDARLVSEGAHILAGAGCGLTPAGDDFLLGIMVWAWLAHPKPQAICRAVLQGVGNRTTVLSLALLRAAGRGEFDATWHGLLSELAQTGGNLGAATVRRILARGSTSGADGLAGFLWLALCPEWRVPGSCPA